MPRKKLPNLKLVEGSKKLVNVERSIIDVAVTSGNRSIPQKQAREFLGVRHHRTLKNAISALNIKFPVNLEDLKKLFALRTLLQFERGNPEIGRTQMAYVINTNQHHELLKAYGFNLDQQFEERKNEYFNCNQRAS